MKPSNGYRLNRGYLLGTVIGFACALPFIFSRDPLTILALFPAVGGPVGWIVAFLQMGGDLD